ncbi:MAG: response regulator transcription factor [Bacillota bacterium]|nr:response regulator transcription factor [Bacillota bacterium]
MDPILIVDDEKRIRDVIREYAEFHGYSVVESADGMDAVHQVRNQTFSLIVMDVMMPKMDGFTAASEIRKISDVPLILLTARGEEYDKLHGFELGIDDYIVKPFSPNELIARIRAVLSRTRRETVSSHCYGELCLDEAGRVVTVSGQSIALTPKEYDLLVYLIRNKNIALSRSQILEHVWGYDFFGDDRTVDSHIKMLRANLGSTRDRIVTVRGVGYKFEP